MSKKTFICYSHKDRERFVSGFYKKLMSYGVDISIDELDILPGDSLPTRIFDELIDDCENFIVVLSEHSIKSKWVNEELDSGMIQKITKGARLIPIVLDNLALEMLPNRLRHLHCHYIKNLNDFEDDAKFVADVCLGNTEIHRPLPLPPRIDSSTIPNWPGFNKIDVLVLTEIITIAMEQDTDWIEGQELMKRLSDQLTIEQLVETIDFLESKRAIKVERTTDRKIENSMIEVYTQTIIYYLKYCFDDVDNRIMKPLASCLLLKGDVWLVSSEISKELGINHYLFRKLLDRFSANEYIMSSQGLSGKVRFIIQNPGKRFFREILGN